jgi:hypothetical protein
VAGRPRNKLSATAITACEEVLFLAVLLSYFDFLRGVGPWRPAPPVQLFAQSWWGLIYQGGLSKPSHHTHSWWPRNLAELLSLCKNTQVFIPCKALSFFFFPPELGIKVEALCLLGWCYTT